ncbi:hypothetical protein C8J43_1042 [Sphingomonas sp. PP-CE-1G-424]|nr:hypothetical protein C8J43_1042 [Sphingomonas sp. PP-CE-1G-424]
MYACLLDTRALFAGMEESVRLIAKIAGEVISGRPVTRAATR